MPERWLHFFGSIFPHPKTFVVGLSASLGSILGVITQENAVAISLAVVAIGTACGPPLQKALKWWYDFRRDASAADRKVLTGEFEAQVEAKVKLQVQVDQLKAEVAQLTAELLRVKGTAHKAAVGVKDVAARVEAVERTTGSSDSIIAT